MMTEWSKSEPFVFSIMHQYFSPVDELILRKVYNQKPVWGYETQTTELKITEVMQGKIRGEFTMTVAAVIRPNPNWGNRITIKGKFYAQCDGYEC